MDAAWLFSPPKIGGDTEGVDDYALTKDGDTEGVDTSLPASRRLFATPSIHEGE